MGFAATYDVAVDADHVFRKQVAGALHSIAVDILNESPETTDHVYYPVATTETPPAVTYRPMMMQVC